MVLLLTPQESATERWRPILGVESIIVSVISMLSDPNDESPANIDAAVSLSAPALYLTILAAITAISIDDMYFVCY